MSQQQQQKRTLLSKADSAVLFQIFDPESAVSNRTEIFINPSLPSDPHILDPSLLKRLKAQEKEAIALIEKFEKEASSSSSSSITQQSSRSTPLSSSKQEAFQSAITILDDMICHHPNYASARNNRAQLRRWRFGDRNTLCQSSVQLDEDRRAAGVAAVLDLQSAITLASPRRSQDGVSAPQGRTLAQASTQLAALYYAAFKDLESSSGEMVVVKVDDGGVLWSAERFEEEASRLFSVGGLYGNEVAKALAVHTNPHAKLCGNIVQEAMRKELEGF